MKNLATFKSHITHPESKLFQSVGTIARLRYYLPLNSAVSSVAKRTLSVREVWGSTPGPVKSAQRRQRLATVATFLRSCVAQALSRGDGPRNLLVPAVSSVAKRTLSVREVWGLIPGPVKSTQCRQRLATVATFLRSCVAQALSRGNGPRNSLHASA